MLLNDGEDKIALEKPPDNIVIAEANEPQLMGKIVKSEKEAYNIFND